MCPRPTECSHRNGYRLKRAEHHYAGGLFRAECIRDRLILKDPHAESASAYLPARAFSARRVNVRPASFKEPLAIRGPKTIEPQGTLDLELKLERSTQKRYATVAIVDEGILSLTGYKTPDPLKSILAKRRLETRTYETAGWAVQLKQGTPAGHTGGDAPARSSEAPRGAKSVALWAGPIEVPKNGRLPLRFKLPDYAGKLRVMAVVTTIRRSQTSYRGSLPSHCGGDPTSLCSYR